MEKKQTAVEYYAEKDVQLNLDWIREKINSTQWAIKKSFLFIEAKQMENEQFASRDALHAAFKAGWMRANAQTWDDSYFITYLKSLDNDDNI